MRAAVYRGPQEVAVTDVDEPACGPGQVKVEVAFNGICGTDLQEPARVLRRADLHPHHTTRPHRTETAGHARARVLGKRSGAAPSASLSATG